MQQNHPCLSKGLTARCAHDFLRNYTSHKNHKGSPRDPSRIPEGFLSAKS
jgi:hypothetical protein